MPSATTARRSGPGLLWVPMLLCFAFLYLPIAVLVAMSFNDGGSAYSWDGFSFRWYAELAGDARIRSALATSLFVAVGATVIATVLGTLLAVGLARHTRSRLLEASAMAPAILPAVVAGALLVFTLSLDEFVIAFFTAGPTTQTLPIAVYSMVRVGVTPEINALATVLVVVSIAVVVFAARTVRRNEE